MAGSSESAQKNETRVAPGREASGRRYVPYVLLVALLLGLLFIGATRLPQMRSIVGKEAATTMEEASSTPSGAPEPSAVYYSTSVILPDVTENIEPGKDDDTQLVDMMAQVAAEQVVGMNTTGGTGSANMSTETLSMSSTAGYDIVNISVVETDTSPSSVMSSTEQQNMSSPSTAESLGMTSTAGYDYVNITVVVMDTSPSSVMSSTQGQNMSEPSTTAAYGYENMTSAYTEVESSSVASVTTSMQQSPGSTGTIGSMEFTTSIYNFTTAGGNDSVPEKKAFPTEFELCNTSFCSFEGAALDDSFSTCCDPCDNFYGYVCRKNWPPKRSDFDYTDSDNVLSQGIEMKIKQVLDGLQSSASTPLVNLWTPCNAIASAPPPAQMQQMFLSLGFDALRNQAATADVVMTTLGGVMNNLSIAPLLFIEIEKDPADNSKWIIALDEPDILVSPELVKANRAQVKDYLFNMTCVYVTHLYGQPDATVCDTVAMIGIELAEGSTLHNHEARRAGEYEVMLYPQLRHLHNFLSTVMGPMHPLNAQTRILVKSPYYVQNRLSNILSATPIPLYNYVGLHMMVFMAPFLGVDDLLSTTLFTLTGKTWKKPPKWRVCLHLLHKMLPTMMTVLYEAPFKDAVEFEELMGDIMAEQIRGAFLEELPNARFLDAWTRNVVKLKFKKSTIYSFFPLRLVTPEEVLAYRNKLEAAVPRNNNPLVYFANVNQYVAGEWKQPGKMRYFHQRSMVSIFDTTCRYILSENAIIVPVGLFDTSVPTSVREKMFHIPRAAPRISRCLFEATFEGSAFYDQNELAWTELSKTEFEERVKCFANQYKHERGEMSKTYSAIEDNAAIRVSYEVFQDQLFTLRYLDKDYRLEGLGNVTSRQLFFIYYARSFCQNVPPDPAAKDDRENRVNVPLMNSPEFSEAFECPLGTDMNPLDKCNVWD